MSKSKYLAKLHSYLKSQIRVFSFKKDFLFYSLFSLSFVVYFQASLGQDYLWDDYFYLDDENIGFFLESLNRIIEVKWFIPYLIHAVWGNFFGLENVILFKTLSIIIHITNAWLIFSILKNKITAFPLYLLILSFLLHPMQVSVVCWVIQLKTLLSCLFFLLFYKVEETKTLSEKSKFLLMLLFSALSFFSKWSYLPLLLYFWFFYFLRRKIDFKKQAIFFTITTLLAITSIFSSDIILRTGAQVTEIYSNALRSFIDINNPLILRLFTHFFLIVETSYYHLTAPFFLNTNIFLKDVVDINITHLPWRFFIVTLISYTFLRHSKTRLFYLLFLLCLLPISGVIMAPHFHYTVYSSHHGYLTIFFLYICFGVALKPVLYKIKSYTKINNYLTSKIKKLGYIVITLIFCHLCYKNTAYFDNDLIFFTKAYKDSPSSFVASYNLAGVYYGMGDQDDKAHQIIQSQLINNQQYLTSEQKRMLNDLSFQLKTQQSFDQSSD